MFGFLKKKLQEAVSKFTKGAKEEVVEEKIDDKELIEEAKQEEKKILPAKRVHVLPELPAERAEHAREEHEKAPEPSKTEPETVAKTEPAPEPTKKVLEQKIVVEQKETKPGIVVETPKPQRGSITDVHEPRRGFLKSLFGKKPEEKQKPVLKPSPAPERAPSKPKIIEKPEPKVVERKEMPAMVQEEVVTTPNIAPAVHPSVGQKVEEPVIEEEVEEKGFFGKLKDAFTKKTLSEEKFEVLFEDLEMTLLENNVALEVIDKLKDDLKKALTAGKISRLGVEDLVLLSLRQSVDEVLSIPGFDLVERIKKSGKRPYIVAFIGVNGSGKTTTLAKVANLFQVEGLSVVMAASDTFRAAAIDQLKEHADKLGVKLISQGYGADPAAVAFDAVEHAKAKNIDVVMIDTAGRLHSNTNLMAELQKVVRVAKPDLKIFIGESITGNDCVEQAKEFDRLVGIDAIILSKADVDEKGGAALSVSYVTKKPILYLGIGQAYGDLKEFDRDEIVRGLGL